MGAFADLGDGTWVLHYCEHRNNHEWHKKPDLESTPH